MRDIEGHDSHLRRLLRIKPGERPHLQDLWEYLQDHIGQLEGAAKSGWQPAPSMFGTVRNPVRMMMMEHDSAGDLLHTIRQLTNGYTVPEDGCMSYKGLFQALAEFEGDLHQHIHLENNILFPRTIEIEEQVA